MTLGGTCRLSPLRERLHPSLGAGCVEAPARDGSSTTLALRPLSAEDGYRGSVDLSFSTESGLHSPGRFVRGATTTSSHQGGESASRFPIGRRRAAARPLCDW